MLGMSRRKVKINGQLPLILGLFRQLSGLLGQLSGSACAGLTGEHKHREFLSQLQSLRVVTCSLEKNTTLVILTQFKSQQGFNAL